MSQYTQEMAEKYGVSEQEIKETLSEINPTDEWVNYGDINHEIHGGRFIKWTGSMWHIIETRHWEELPEGFVSEGTWWIQHDWIEPSDLFEDGNAEMGPSEAFQWVLNQWQGKDLVSVMAPDENIEYYVVDMMGYAHWNPKEETTKDYWGYLEDYGITPE